MPGIWFGAGVAVILAVIITAARRWERARVAGDRDAGSAATDLGYAGGGDDGASCGSAEGDGCGDASGGDGGA